MNNSNITVTVPICLYNHEAYIDRALMGVLNQKTNYGIRLILGNDCSTDNSKAIIDSYQKEYPDCIEVISHEKNIGAIENSRLLFSKCTSKYIALCDGDDYWVHEQKLQQQIDFLEKHPEYSLCTALYEVEQNATLSRPAFLDNLPLSHNNVYEININNFLNPYVLKTMCVVFRTALFDQQLLNKKYFSDLFIWADLLTKGKGACLNFVGGVYRLHNSGIWSGLDDIGKATENYNLAKEMESSFGNSYKSLKNFRTQQAQHLYNLLKEKEQLNGAEKKVMRELISKKIMAKANRLFTSIFPSKK